MSDALPGFVPLPEVGEYTDRIIVGELGLPVGFDEEALELNVRGCARIAQIGGLSLVGLVGVRGQTSEYGISARGINADGTAVSGLMKTIRKEPLHRGFLLGQQSGALEDYDRPPAIICINNTEIEDRLSSENKWKRGLLDYAGRAHYMDKAVRTGLRQVSNQAEVSAERIGFFSLTGIANTLLAASYVQGNASLADVVTYLPRWGLIINGLSAAWVWKMAGIPPRERKWSVFPFLPLDRIIATNGLALTTKLVRAAKTTNS